MKRLELLVARRAVRGSICSAHGTVVGSPNNSWLNQLPKRPIACATAKPGASASPAEEAAARTGGTRTRRQRAPGHAAPDAQAALPDLQCSDEARAVGTEVGRPVRGHHVVHPRADDAGGHRPQRDVCDLALTAAASLPSLVRDVHGDEDPQQDEHGVRLIGIGPISKTPCEGEGYVRQDHCCGLVIASPERLLTGERVVLQFLAVDVDRGRARMPRSNAASLDSYCPAPVRALVDALVERSALRRSDPRRHRTA